MNQRRIKELLHYNLYTGIFTWRISRGCRKAGEETGCVVGGGHLQIGIDGSLYYAHRLAWLYMTGEWPQPEIDHINGVKDDNSWINLRLATSTINSENQRIARSDNKYTGLLGAYRCNKTSRFRATIQVKGKQYHLGVFGTSQEAHDAYVKAKREVHEGCTI